MDLYFGNLLDELDASVFSGDSLCEGGTLAEFEKYLDRWSRSVTEQKLINALDVEII